MHQSIRNKSSGFTLIEVLVTLVIIAIMAGVSAPAILSMAPNIALKSTAQNLFSTIQEGKVRAIKENRDVTIRFDTPGFYYFDDDNDGAYTAGEERVIMSEDVNLNKTLDAGEDLNGNGRLDTSYYIGYGTPAANNDWNAKTCVQLDALTFNSRGLPTLILLPPKVPPAAPSTPNVYIQNQEGIVYAISISVAGSVKIRKHDGANWN